MSDDELRDGLGREIERALGGGRDDSAEARGARETVQRRARTRRRNRTTSITAVVLVVAVAGVAIANRDDDSVKVSTNRPPTTQPSCAPTDSHSFVWNGVRYTLSEPVLNGTPELRLGKTCGGRPIWRIAGYAERAALGVGIGTPHVYTATMNRPYTGTDVFDLGNKPDGDITRIDVHTPAMLATPIITEPRTIRDLLDGLLAARGTSRAPADAEVLRRIVALHRRDGAIIEFSIDSSSAWTGTLQLSRQAASLITHSVQAAARLAMDAARAGGGVAVVHGSETVLYDNDGDQISLLPTPRDLPGYFSPPPGGSNSTMLGVVQAGSRFVLQRNQAATTPRPPRAAPDCTDFVTAGDYTAALCAATHRVDVIGREGVVATVADEPENGGEGFWNPIPGTLGRALVTHIPHECQIASTALLDASRTQPRWFDFATGIGWTRGGQAIIAINDPCRTGDAPPRGVYLVNPANGAKERVISNVPELAYATDGTQQGTVYRWTFAG